MNGRSVPRIDMAGPDVSPVDLQYVQDAMTSGWYPPNAYKYVELFEKEFATFHDRLFGLMTPNCTSAIHLVLEALEAGTGTEVIAPESTWIGSTAGISHAGAHTVFADVDEEKWCLSAESVRDRLTSRTRAIIAVDLYGNMPEWDELEELSTETDVPLIEDAAEALGSQYKGRRAGKFGIASVFSFHRTKTLTTGEGGIILTDDESLFERCRFLRDHGRAPGSYFNTEVAFKYMPSNLQAALGYGQLMRVHELIENKRRIFHRYRHNLSRTPGVKVNREDASLINGAWATAVVFDVGTNVTTEFALDFLSQRDVPVRPFFYPLSSLPAYAMNTTGGPMRNPVAYDLGSRGIHLPCAMNLTEDQIDYISAMVAEMVSARIGRD